MNPRQFDRREIRDRIPELQALLTSYGVRAAYLFGSLVDGPGGRPSDLDLAVLPPSALDNWWDYYNSMHRDVCRLFAADNVDLVLLNQAPFALQARVVHRGLPFVSTEESLDWQEDVRARYLDLYPWREENWAITQRLARQGLDRGLNMVDRSRVERFVFLIRDAVGELKDLNVAAMSCQDYQADKRTRALSEHYLRIALEATLDLGRHVAVNTGLGVPEEYRDVGKILSDKGVLPADLGRQLQDMAGMRNVLVHLYWDIDHTKVYDAVTKELDTFGQCVQHIFRYLDAVNTDTY